MHAHVSCLDNLRKIVTAAGDLASRQNRVQSLSIYLVTRDPCCKQAYGSCAAAVIYSQSGPMSASRASLPPHQTKPKREAKAPMAHEKLLHVSRWHAAPLYRHMMSRMLPIACTCMRCDHSWLPLQMLRVSRPSNRVTCSWPCVGSRQRRDRNHGRLDKATSTCRSPARRQRSIELETFSAWPAPEASPNGTSDALLQLQHRQDPP